MNASQSELLTAVVDQYLNSGDFNGYRLDGTSFKHLETREADLRTLINEGYLEVISEVDFPNPHIRPWPNARPREDQLYDAMNALSGGSPLCLYPSAATMASHLPADAYSREPYARALAEGAGQLEYRYFKIDVLEQYLRDPRYYPRHWDFGVSVGIGDEAFLDDAEDPRDKITTVDVGFSYDSESLQTEHIRRFACTIVRDMASLTPEHQRRWETYEVDAAGLHPHPMWHWHVLGHWADGIGPFERLMGELSALNDLFRRSFGTDLFGRLDRPEELRWVLRPSSSELSEFVLTLDKLLGDNLRDEAFTTAGIEQTDDDGRRLPTMRRFELLLQRRARVPEDQARQAFQHWRKIRRDR